MNGKGHHTFLFDIIYIYVYIYIYILYNTLTLFEVIATNGK